MRVDSRAEVALRAPPDAIPAEPGPDDAEPGVLAVRVVEQGSGIPVAHVSVTLSPGGHGGPRLNRARPRPDTGSTDEHGLVELEFSPGIEMVVSSAGDWLRDPWRLAVEPLSAGERRALVLELPLASHDLVVGRVVAAETGLPLPESRVAVCERSGAWGFRDGRPMNARDRVLAEVPVDTDGRFEIRMSRQAMLIEVTAPGRALAVRLHEPANAGAPLVVPLELGATLEVELLGHAGHSPGDDHVVVRTGFHLLLQGTAAHAEMGEANWTARVGPDGRALLPGLPPRMPLDVSCRLPGESGWHAGPTVTLAPGEVRTVRIDLDAGAQVAGTVSVVDGGDPGSLAIWLEPGRDGQHPAFATLMRLGGRKTRTDAAGSFMFHDVPDGAWLVGPAPDTGFPPRAEVVHVEGGHADRAVRLVLRNDLTIRGRVVNEAGEPVMGATVFAEGSDGFRSKDTTSFWGEYSVGPLTDASYTVRALGSRNLTDSKAVEASPGASTVDLMLGRGGTISGLLLDENSRPVSGRVMLVTETPGKSIPLAMTEARSDGSFRLTGLPAASYRLSATASEGRVSATDGIRVGPGEETSVQLRLRAGAVLVLRGVAGGARTTFRVLDAEGVVASGAIDGGTSAPEVVPAGSLRVEQWAEHGYELVTQVALAPGERREVALGAGMVE